MPSIHPAYYRDFLTSRTRPARLPFTKKGNLSRSRSRSRSRGSTVVLLPSGALIPVRPEGEDFEENAEEGEDARRQMPLASAFR